MDFFSFMSIGFFYFCSVPDYKKWGIWRFETNGTISGLHSWSESNWRIEDGELKILDGIGQVTCIFKTIIKSENRTVLLRQEMENVKVALIPAEIVNYETLDAPSKEDNLIEACLKPGSVVSQKLREFILQDKTIDGYHNGLAYIVPRNKLKIGLNQYKGVYYQAERPKNSEPFFSSKLLVWFSGVNDCNKGHARTNFFPNPFWGAANNLAKNTAILRIADSNLVNGSYYFNTVNFPDYEDCVQELIRKVANDYQVAPENIVCAGSSRGGTGALYHGLLGGYSVVSMDPIINRRPWLQEGDPQLMFDCIPVSFEKSINDLLEKTKPAAKSQIQVISSPNVPVTYPYIMQLDREKFQLSLLYINLIDRPMDNQPSGESMHEDFVNLNAPLLLYKINQILYGNDMAVLTRSD